MNSVQLTGRLTNDPEIIYGNNGSTVAKFSLAVNRRYKQEGQPDADFIRCVAFGRTAEFIEKYFTKGRKMDLNGRIQTGSYTKEDGTKVFTTEVVVENVEFGESKSVTSTNNETASDSAKSSSDGFMNIPDGLDEELPFS